MRVILACAGALLAAALPRPAVARAGAGVGGDELFWTTFGSGSYFDPANWSEPRVPTAFDTVVFKNDAEYTVVCGVPATVDRLLVRAGRVTYLLAGGSIAAINNTGAVSTVIGELPDDDAVAIFRDGRFQPVSVTLGLAEDSQGTAVIDGAGARFLPEGHIVIGHAGEGALALERAARAQIADIASRTTIGLEASGSGALYLSNANTRWTSSGQLLVAVRGVGAVHIDDRASLTTGETHVALHAGSRGAINIHDASAVINGDLFLGFGDNPGQAQLAVADGGSITADTIRIGALSNLTGDGLVLAHVQSAGTIRPGDLSIGAPTPSVLTIDGDYTMLDGAALRIDVGEPPEARANGADQLVVSGHARLDGALIVDLLFGAQLENGERFDILAAASRRGRFDALVLPALDDGLDWRVRYRDDGAQLRVVPAPAAAAALLALAAGLPARRRR